MNRRVSVTVDADINPFVRSLATGSAAAKSFAHDLESADGRMANLVQTGLALAPAFVPIGAAAIPILAGLTNQLGATAAAAGVTVLAFQGIGDALDALNDYQIDPTDAHLKKLQETMDAIGPAGQVFVRTLQDLRPELQDLQDVAQQEMFPGLTKSLHEIFQLAPQVEHIIGTIAGTLGDIAADAGDGLNDQRWVEFIDYLDREARPTLTAMGKTFGFVIEGLASLMMDLDPLADDFTQGMVGYAKAFRGWADGLDDTQGFKDFVDYIRQNGPEAGETLAAIGDALVGLITAAAPVGSALLPVIEALADGLGAIARSPIGPVVVGAAAAIGTLGRSLAILKAVGLGSGDSLLARVFQVDKIKAGAKALTEVTSAQDRARLSSAALLDVEQKRAGVARAGFGQLGRNAALLGGLALATSGYAEKTSAANTATFALMGTIAGPWGAAAGAAVGLTMDLAGANNDLEQAVRGANSALESFDLGRMTSALADLNGQIDATNAKLTVNPSFNPFSFSKENLDALITGVNELATGSGKAAEKTRDDLEDTTKNLELALNILGQGFGALDVGEHTKDLDELNTILTRAKPAMDALGISVEDLADAAGDGSILDLADRIQGYIQWSDSAEGRTQALADSMAALDDDMTSTATAADLLKNSLDSLLGPGLNVSAATDQWRAGLRNLTDALADNGRSLTAQTDAADKNRAAIRDQVTNLTGLLKAQADNGAGARQLTRNMRAGRDAILDAGAAAGLSRRELNKYLNDLGLTPKVVRTLIDANTDPAVRKKKQLMAELAEVDRYRATPSVDLDTSSANAKLASLQAAIGSLHVPASIAAPAKKAFGGQVFGPGGPRDDTIPALLSNREWVMPVDAVDHYGSEFMRAIQLRRFADGGQALTDAEKDEKKRRAAAEKYGNAIRSADRDFTFGNDPTVSSVRSELRAFARDVREAGGHLGASFDHLGKRAIALTRTYEREDQAREKARQYRDQIRSQAVGSFNNDIFGGGLSDLQLQLSADTNDAAAMDRALEAAAAKGLDGDFAAQLGGSGNLLLAQQIAGLSRGQIKNLEAQYIGRGTAQTALGQQVVDMSGVQKAIDAHTKTMSNIDKRLNGIENRIEAGVYRGAKDGVEGKDHQRNQRVAARKRTK